MEVGGPTSSEALSLLRACRGLDIVAAEILTLIAVKRSVTSWRGMVALPEAPVFRDARRGESLTDESSDRPGLERLREGTNG